MKAWFLLHLVPRAGLRDDLIAFFRDVGVLEAASEIPGFLEGHLLVEQDGGLLVASSWRDTTAYGVWEQSDARRRIVARMAPMLDSPPRVVAYRHDHMVRADPETALSTTSER